MHTHHPLRSRTAILPWKFAVLLTLWAGVASASEYPVAQPLSRESCQRDTTVLGASAWSDGAFQTISGASIRGASPGHGVPLSRALGPCPNPDNLNSYAVGTTGAYDTADQTALLPLWNVVSAPCLPDCPPPIVGTRSLWMGKCDPTWAVHVGYPNNTYQILYVDTGSHLADYVLTLDYNVSSEYGYDFLYLVGGGGNGVDPVGCNRAMLDNAIQGGGVPGSPTLLASWTGSIRAATPGATSMDTRAFPAEVAGARADPPQDILSASIQIAAEHRALYFVFKSDERFSHEDGLWCQGKGAELDSIVTSDNGLIYSEQASVGLVGGACGEKVIVGTLLNPVVSARVPNAVGDLWTIRSGSELPTPDPCSPSKGLASDHMFFGGDQTTLQTIPTQFNSIVGCSFAVPVNTASVRAVWNEYLDLPRDAGFVRFAEVRTHSHGAWTRWSDAASGGGVNRGAIRGWRTEIEDVSDCEGADSVQVRYTLQCVPLFAADHTNCMAIPYGVLLDDFRLQLIAGPAAPIFGIFPGSIAQSTFVDGTMTGINCNAAAVAAGHCWPGPRGSSLGAAAGAIDDNVNSPLGDSMTVSIRASGLSNGRRINWRHAFDKCVNGGLTIAYTNAGFVPAHDVPRLIYRLFDPATKLWSPFDSSELDVDALTISSGCGAPTDSVLSGCTFRWDWPPRDKAGSNLPGGFTINGIAAYSSLAFLPKGTRLQYYFKAVDILGTRTYQFQSDQPAFELLDLPFLPGGTIRAPDIMEFDVLPGAYPAGAAGTLLAGRSNTPVLNLDDSYTTWGFGEDPVTYALRGLGVRADRYRLLQGLEEGNNIGGHELAGLHVRRLGNFFPNPDETDGILDSLAAWYRIIILSAHVRHSTVLEEQDAKLLRNWWLASTGNNGGDRCVLATGDDFFESLHSGPPIEIANQTDLSQTVFGVQSAAGAWSGTFSNPYPLIDDRFDGSGAGLTPAGTFTYILDGGCPNLSRFDALTKVPSSDAVSSAFYPGGEVAGIANNAEWDVIADSDRSKALGYGYSYEFIRRPGSAPDQPGNCCGYGGLYQRLRVLYKFLTSCRGPRTTETGVCWPCPGDTTTAAMTGNWAANPNFGAATYGPLYPIQDFTIATGVEQEPGSGAPSFLNALSQNRPNPFNPETLIPYSLASRGRVTVRIYDISGRCIRTLVDAVKNPGIYQVRWTGELDSGRKAASSIYFYRITYPDGKTSARKTAILR